jgi:hypothetical protein
MRSLLSALLLALQACIVVHAIHKTDVGLVDWHRQLIGVPLAGSSSTAPTFCRSSEGKELILTATTSNVLAALSPEDGHVGEFLLTGMTRVLMMDVLFSMAICL